MEGHAGDGGFEAFLQNLQMDFPISPASSDITSSAAHVSSHPPLPQSQSFSQSKHKGRQSPSPMPLEIHHSFGKPPNFSSNVGYDVVDKPPQRGTHRRAHSEIAFRLPDQFMVDQDPVVDNAESSTFSDETGEDLLSAYLEMESSTPGDGLSHSATSSGLGHAQGSPVDDVLAEYDSIRSMQDVKEGNIKLPRSRPPRHHHSMSMDGSLSLTEDFLMSGLDFLETKKAMDTDQLAGLSVTDPRRAKRILANRQSAARSKERKLKYIAELEQKIQKLQTESTSLSAQLTTMQRDNKGLSTQNSELKLRLQAMEQQALLRDALNETLKEEVQWLKSATVQLGLGNGHVFTFDTHHQASKQPF